MSLCGLSEHGKRMMNSRTVITFLSNKQISRDIFWNEVMVVVRVSHCASLPLIALCWKGSCFLARNATAIGIFALPLLVLKAFKTPEYQGCGYLEPMHILLIFFFLALNSSGSRSAREQELRHSCLFEWICIEGKSLRRKLFQRPLIYVLLYKSNRNTI